MSMSYISLEEAVERLLEGNPAPENAETVPLQEALGRTVAAETRATVCHPAFDRSPLDGYALRHADTVGASRQTPARLRVVGRTYAGDPPLEHPLEPGEAVRVMTGAALPPGADCVLRQEDTDEGTEWVEAYVPLRRHQNYCFRGEDVHTGALLVRIGEVLDFPHLGVLAGQGLTEVAVYPQPTVGVLSTGSELVAAGRPLPPGKIYDTNGMLIATRVSMLGGVPYRPGGVEDSVERLTRTVEDLLQCCDMVVTTGGVSVGERDCMPDVAERLAATRLFHGVAVKPGAPAMAVRVGGKTVLCLSGNPYAAAATFELLARPLLLRLAGRADPCPAYQTGRMAEAFPKASPGRRFLRARMDSGWIHIPREHESGKLASMMCCNCLIDVPAGSPPLKVGDSVRVLPFGEEDSLWRTPR